MDISSDKLIDFIALNDPKHENEILLQFINNISVKELFLFCMELFHKICIVKYGSSDGKVDLTNWNFQTIEYINKYFKSFGMYINIEILAPISDNINKLNYYKSRSYDCYPITNNTKISDLYYSMYSNDTNNWFIINFNFLKYML
jgi:hypothetical protein